MSISSSSSIWVYQKLIEVIRVLLFIIYIFVAIELELQVLIFVTYYLLIIFSYMPLKIDRLVTQKHKFHFL